MLGSKKMAGFLFVCQLCNSPYVISRKVKKLLIRSSTNTLTSITREIIAVHWLPEENCNFNFKFVLSDIGSF